MHNNNLGLTYPLTQRCCQQISAESLDRAVSPDNSVAEGEERTVEKEAEAWDSIKHLLPAIL